MHGVLWFLWCVCVCCVGCDVLCTMCDTCCTLRRCSVVYCNACVVCCMLYAIYSVQEAMVHDAAAYDISSKPLLYEAISSMAQSSTMNNGIVQYVVQRRISRDGGF